MWSLQWHKYEVQPYGPSVWAVTENAEAGSKTMRKDHPECIKCKDIGNFKISVTIRTTIL